MHRNDLSLSFSSIVVQCLGNVYCEIFQETVENSIVNRIFRLAALIKQIEEKNQTTQFSRNVTHDCPRGNFSNKLSYIVIGFK